MILAIAMAGDRDAFERLFRQFAPRVKTYYLKCGASEAMAEELVQETMLMVWRKSRLFDPRKAGAATWIFTIARNLFVDAWRRARRPEFDAQDPALVRNPEREIDSELIRSQSEVLVREAVGGLPAEQREVLELSFFSEQPHSAIAKRLELPIGTVKSRMRLALKRMRSQLKA